MTPEQQVRAAWESVGLSNTVDADGEWWWVNVGHATTTWRAGEGDTEESAWQAVLVFVAARDRGTVIRDQTPKRSSPREKAHLE